MGLVRRYGIGSTTLARILKEFSIPVRGKKYPGKVAVQRRLEEREEKKIVTAYLKGTPGTDLARQHKCTSTLIYDTLHRYSIPLRRRGPAFVALATKKRIAEAARRRWADEGIRKKYLPLLLSVSFKPTVGNIPYPLLNTRTYRDFRAAIIQRDGSRCVRCKSDKCLHVHHIEDRRDKPKRLLDPANVETLCCSCHMKEEAHRKHENFADVLPYSVA